MSRILTLSVLLVAILAANSFAQNVVVPSGSKLAVASKKAIDSSVLKMGDELNFTLADDLVVGGTTIPRGTEVLGRVLESAQYDAKSRTSHVVVMFDFLKVLKEEEEYYYVMQARIENAAETVKGLRIAISKEFEGGTVLSMRGGDLKLAQGTVFEIKVIEDVTDA